MSSDKASKNSSNIYKIFGGSFLALSLGYFSFKLYKHLTIPQSPSHLCILSRHFPTLILSSLPIKFTEAEALPAVLKPLESLPGSISSYLCPNIFYSQVTPSTQKIIENHFELINEGVLYLADVQTSGIGRTGAWQSEIGCLMFTYKYSCNVKFALSFQMAIALSIIKAIRAVGDSKGVQVENIKAKWPNDVYLNGRKLGGILVNSKSANKLISMTIGIGVNVSNKGENISLEEVYPGVFDRGSVLKAYLIEFDNFAQMFGKEGWEAKLIEEYKSVWMHYLKPAKLMKLDLEGIITSISHEGTIMVRDKSGSFHTAHSREDIQFMD